MIAGSERLMDDMSPKIPYMPQTDAVADQVVVHASVDSTNVLARRLIQSGVLTLAAPTCGKSSGGNGSTTRFVVSAVVGLIILANR